MKKNKNKQIKIKYKIVCLLREKLVPPYDLNLGEPETLPPIS